MEITVAAPNAKAAGLDAFASAFSRKMTESARHFPALRRLGIIFRLVVWSAELRAHPAASRQMDNAIQLFSHLCGQEAASAMRGRWHPKIGVALQRRKAATIRAVLPRAMARQCWLAEAGACAALYGRLLSVEERGEVTGDEEDAT